MMNEDDSERAGKVCFGDSRNIELGWVSCLCQSYEWGAPVPTFAKSKDVRLDERRLRDFVGCSLGLIALFRTLERYLLAKLSRICATWCQSVCQGICIHVTVCINIELQHAIGHSAETTDCGQVEDE